MHTFDIKDEFRLDGQPFRILSGSMHYFRTVPQDWRDRLEKLRALGLNTVETYIPWNLHEPRKGSFRFTGLCDVERFIRLAQQLGLYVIVRPSPYICAEWEFGGLPAWLLAEKNMRLRCCDAAYLAHVQAYYDELMPRLAALQITRGGPILMMQVENEYGSYGDDGEYLAALRGMMRRHGIDVPLVTSDGPENDMMNCGACAGTHPTGNFGSHAKENFDYMTSRGIRPLMCMEYWCGWFDHWGEPHHAADPVRSSADFEEILRRGHVNIYMFHGGTNFGLMNGANYFDDYQPTVSSYDYDALLTEDGRITEKYRLFGEAIARVTGKAFTMPAFSPAPRRAYGKAILRGYTPLLAAVRRLPAVRAHNPVSMERLGQDYGYTLYHTTLVNEKEIRQMRLLGAADRAQVYLDGRRIATWYDHELEQEHLFEAPLPVRPNASLDILVENMGRVNYGWKLESQRKGIDGGVILNHHFRFDWEMTCLGETAIRALPAGDMLPQDGAAGAYRFSFSVDEPADTYVRLPGFGKGIVFLNGFTLGRFWEIGPQKTLYAPTSLLKCGENELLVFETEGRLGEALLQDEPDLG